MAMAKRPIIQSDSEGSDEAEKDIFPASKRPKPSLVAAQSSGSGSSSDPDSDAEWTMDIGSSKKPATLAKKGQKGPGGGGGGGGGSGAGGGWGRGGGGKAAAQRKTAAKKMASLPSSSDSSDDEDEDDEEKEEEGQQSSGSGGSSSDSDSSSESSLKFDDGLDDRLLGDEEDKRMLSLMTETEREADMYNRYERREALKARFEIEQRLIRQKKSMKKKSKQDKMKRSMRDKRTQKQDKSKSQAMDEYKAKRSADKIRKAEAEKQPEEKEPLKVSDVFSSESESENSSSSSSDNESEDGMKFRFSKPISNLSELAKIKISRYRLEKWVHMPFFSEAVIGCFVRIGIGAHEGRMVYRVCEITNVQETQKVYSLGSTKTNKGLKLRHGIQERIFRIEYVSNSPFLETEFTNWVTEMEKQGLELPTVDFVQKKVKDVEKYKNTSLKEEDVEKIVKEKQRFRKNPRNYAMTKSRLLREKDSAEQEGDIDKTKSLAEKLLELEERADLLDKQRTKGLSAISYINERNRHRNVVRAEMALKEELAATEGKEDDPFTRRKCQPTLVTLAVRDGTDLLQQVAQGKSTPVREAKAGGSDVEETPNGQKLSRGMDGTPNASLLLATPIPPPFPTEQVNDLFSAHDFDIQIDLPSAEGDSSTPKSLPRCGTAPKQDGPKRSLNLADYKKRRGLI